MNNNVLEVSYRASCFTNEPKLVMNDDFKDEWLDLLETRYQGFNKDHHPTDYDSNKE